MKNNIQTKIYLKSRYAYIRFLRRCFATLGLLALPVIVSAQTVTPAALPFLNPNKLYAVPDGNTVYVYDSIALGIANTTRTSLFTFSGTGNGSTIAIGPWFDGGTHGVGNMTIVAYTWPWNNTVVNVRKIKPNYPANADVSQFTVPPSNSTGVRYWSGGEVNQLTGEIYFSGGEDTRIETTFRMGIYNPYTLLFTQSGRLQPRTPADALNGYVFSDMAIDADGNAYIVVQEVLNSTANLLKVEVDRNGGTWYYSRVRSFTFSNTSTDTWGMAFLYGKLYMTVASRIYELNPLTGVVVDKGGTGTLYLDLSAAQTAVVVRGKVYNDLNGNNANDDGNAGVSNQTIEVYDSNKTYLGNTTTNTSGEYTLMLPMLNTDYYVRLKNPKIGGKKAVQTWANAGTYTHALGQTYTVTAYSHDLSTDNLIPITPASHEDVVTCWGAHDGFRKADPTASDMNNAMIYSKINLGVNITGVVNFGITTLSDFGDASFESRVDGANTGPMHLVVHKMLYLGHDVSADADSLATVNSDSFDDGVFVVVEGENILLSDTVLEAGETYTFKVLTGGYKRADGYLNAYVSCNGSGAISPSGFTTRIGTLNMQIPPNSDTITFDYTVPVGIPQGRNTAYMRFRFSNAPGLGAAGNPDYSSGTPYWGIYGEVEDYRIFLRKRNVPPVISYTWPTAASLTYGDSLGMAAITGGNINLTGAPPGTPTGGKFAFKHPRIYPKVANSNITNYAFRMIPDAYDYWAPVEKTDSMKVTVYRKLIGINAVQVADKFHDGTDAAWVKNVTFSGLVLNDALIIDTDYTATATFANTGIGLWDVIGNIALSTNPATVGNNYELDGMPPGSSNQATIMAAPPHNGVVVGTETSGLSYAILDLSAGGGTSQGAKGLRLPRLSNAARNDLSLSGGTPEAEGLLIFNSDANNIQYWNGTEWRSIASSEIAWAETGHTDKTPGSVLINDEALQRDVNFASLMEIESAKRGLRLPQTTTEQADGLVQANGVPQASRAGLLVYNVDVHKVQYWDGTQWIALDGTPEASVSGTPPSVGGGITIGVDAPPAYYSILELSAFKALVLPVLNVDARNSALTASTPPEKAAATGLLIFNSETKKLEFFDGSTWRTAQ